MKPEITMWSVADTWRKQKPKHVNPKILDLLSILARTLENSGKRHCNLHRSAKKFEKF